MGNNVNKSGDDIAPGPSTITVRLEVSKSPTDKSLTVPSDLSTAVLKNNPSSSISKKNLSWTPHSASPATKLAVKPQPRRTSFLNINNGVTGKFISSRICTIAAEFWYIHIDTMSVDQQLEIGCSIFFGMIATNSEMKRIMHKTMTKDGNKQKIESTSLKYLDMLGWLIRYLTTDNINLYHLLTQLGGMHRSMGIRIEHFDPMLQAMHETFAYYFDTAYKIEVKYAMDEIFTLAAQIMTGQELRFCSHLNDITLQFQGKNNEIEFLHSLGACLSSSVGREYLYRFLAQTWCDEIVIFLQLVSRFKKLVSDKERFMMAREINKVSIQPSATFTLNLSYENRHTTMTALNKLDSRFATKEDFAVPLDLFEKVEKEIEELVLDNHWEKFKSSIKMLQSKSINMH